MGLVTGKNKREKNVLTQKKLSSKKGGENELETPSHRSPKLPNKLPDGGRIKSSRAMNAKVWGGRSNNSY